MKGAAERAREALSSADFRRLFAARIALGWNGEPGIEHAGDLFAARGRPGFQRFHVGAHPSGVSGVSNGAVRAAAPASLHGEI